MRPYGGLKTSHSIAKPVLLHLLMECFSTNNLALRLLGKKTVSSFDPSTFTSECSAVKAIMLRSTCPFISGSANVLGTCISQPLLLHLVDRIDSPACILRHLRRTVDPSRGSILDGGSWKPNRCRWRSEVLDAILTSQFPFQ